MDEEKMQMMLSRMMDGKQTFTYKKLVVPMSMRSIYWKYFGFPATDDGDILTKVKIVCILCKTQIAYNRNTSNLRMHLQNKHAQEFFELEANAPPRRPSVDPKEKRAQKKLLKSMKADAGPHIYTTAADGTVQLEGDVQFITDPNINIQNFEDYEDSSNENNVRVLLKGGSSGLNDEDVEVILPDDNLDSSNHVMVDGKTVSDAIAEFVILDLQLPDVVEGRGFQRLISTLRSPCEIPSKSQLEEEVIPKIYDSFREAIQCSFASITGKIALSVEEWNSRNGADFITIAVHYQNQTSESVMETKVLSTLNCSSDIDVSQWNVTLDNLFADWDIKLDNITAVVVASSRHELLQALSDKGLIVVPCLVHSLQACTSTCFKDSKVEPILNKCRLAIGFISRNSAATTSLRFHEQTLQLEENPLKKDYPQVWTSTYTMLEQLLVRKEIMSTILENLNSIDRDTVTLSEEEWKIVEDLVTVLEPFMVTIMTLSEEKTPIVSLLKPLLWQLNSSHLKVKEDDSGTAQAFKYLLSKNLAERYSSKSVNHLLNIATALDPRFKLLPYASENEKNIISTSIKDMLMKFIEEDEMIRSDIIEESPMKKSRLSGMEYLLGQLHGTKSGMPAEERANLELVQYQSESIASLDFSPLQWWTNKASAKCPNLAQLAQKYSCIPVSATPPHRVQQQNQILFNMRRACLGPQLVDKLLFLNGNHNVEEFE